MTKTPKSGLLHLLEKDVLLVEAVPNNAVWVVDAIALLQSIPHVPHTFGELAETISSMATVSLTLIDLKSTLSATAIQTSVSSLLSTQIAAGSLLIH